MFDDVITGTAPMTQRLMIEIHPPAEALACTVSEPVPPPAPSAAVEPTEVPQPA